MQDRLDDKIDKVTSMIGKLTTQGDNQNRWFKPKIYQSKQRGQSRNYYDQNNCDQGNYQNRYRSDSGDRGISFRGRDQYRQNYRGRPQYINKYRNNFRRDNYGDTQNHKGKNLEVDIEKL